MKSIIKTIVVLCIVFTCTSCKYNHNNVYYTDNSHTILKLNDSVYMDVPASEFKVSRLLYLNK